LADRGFEHGELIRCGSVPGEDSPGHLPWLRNQQWAWAIRAKSDLKITLASGQCKSVANLLPEPEHAALFRDVKILGDIQCHLATAHASVAQAAWAVITDTPPSLQTFALYGQRFGGIEPHFKDYKSAAFKITRSKIRDAQALSRLLMLLAAATIIAMSMAIEVIAQGRLKSIDWLAQRGLSFLQIGLRYINELCYLRTPLPQFVRLPRANPPPAYASLKKRDATSTRIEFAKVTFF
jgi:hypothetical protein